MDLNHRTVFELLAHQELVKFQEFIKNHWGGNHLFANDRSVLDWQHKGPDAYHYMVAKQGESLVGVQGVIPLSQFDDRLPRTHIFVALWKALEDRGIGIGLRLYKNVLREYRPEFIGSIGIDRRAVPLHEWQGFTVGLMDHHVALSPFVKEFRIAEVPGALKPQPRKERSSISVQKLTQADLQGLDTAKLYSHQCPLKSDTYIRNRFMNHPVYTYDVYAVAKENELQAMCVIRAICEEDSVVLRLVDFIGPNDAVPLLHDLVTDLLKTSHAEYVDIYSHGIPSKLIKEAGFIDRRKAEGLIVPNWFEPFVRKNVDLIFAYKAPPGHARVRLFKADGDQDRPNQLQRGRGVRHTLTAVTYPGGRVGVDQAPEQNVMHDLKARRAYWDEQYVRYWQERTTHHDQAHASGDCVPADVRQFERYLDKLPVKPGDRVLDVGVGFGRLVPPLLRRGAVVYGIDISPQMIAKAQRQVGADVRELCVDAVEELRYDDSSFDHVICWAVFDACDQGEALRQMARVLKPGGRLLISGKNDDYLDDDELGYVAEINARAKGHPNFFTNLSKLFEAVKSLGLREEHTFYFVRRGDGSDNRVSTVRPARFYEYVMICAKVRHVETRHQFDVARAMSVTCARRQRGGPTATSGH